MERLDRRDLLAADGFALSFGTSLNPDRVDDVGDAIAVDNTGNMYVASTDRAGRDDGWERTDVDKYSGDGELIWSYHRATRGDAFSTGIAVAEDGSVFMIGDFKNTVTFDFATSESRRTSAGSFDFFVLKLNPEGRYESVQTFGQSGGAWDRATDIAVDRDGNLLITGYFGGRMDFDPDPDNAVMLSANGNNEMFVMKLAPDGNLIWAKALGGDQSDGGTNEIENATTVATDSVGNVYVGGYFVGDADFDRDASHADNRDRLTARGTWDAFLAKYDAEGTLQWVRQMGATGGNFETVSGVATDSENNPIVTGTFRGSDFDPGDGSSVASTNNGFDIFVSKFDPAGSLTWSQRVGDTGDDRGRGIAVGMNDSLYVGGFFNGLVDFNSSDDAQAWLNSGAPGFTNAGTGFLLTLDASGDFVSVGRHGGSGRDAVVDVAANLSGSAYITGFFEEAATFDVGTETIELTSHGGKDVFVAKVVTTIDEPLGEVRGVKWNDLNGNGIQDPGEPGLPEWTITLDGTDLNGNAVHFETTTMADDPETSEVDESGMYLFPDVPAGSYTITEVPQDGWRQTAPQFIATLLDDEAASGTGAVWFSLDRESRVLHFELSFDGLQEPPTTLVLQQAGGPVLHDLAAAAGEGPVISSPVRGDVTLSPAEIDLLDAGELLVRLDELGDSGFVRAGEFSSETSQQLARHEVADFDSDGILDVVALGITSNSVFVWNGDGTGQLVGVNEFELNPGGPAATPQSLAVADLDGDGTPDIVVGEFLEDHVTFLFNDGNGAFENVVRAPTAGFSRPRGMIIGDVNGDSLADLVVNYFDGRFANGDFAVWLNPGSTGFTETSRQQIGAGGSISVELGDFNGDTHLDAVVTTLHNNIGIALGNGDGTFQPFSLVDTGELAESLNLETGDFDANGTLDVIVTDRSGKPRFMLGDGNGSFSQGPFLPIPTNAGVVRAGDIDGDGDLDFVANSTLLVDNDGVPGPSVYVLRNDGDLQNLVLEATLDEPAVTDIQLADYNSDARLDFSLSDEDGNVTVYLNDREALTGPVMAGSDHHVVLTGNTIITDRDFGNVRVSELGSIHGVKWIDPDGDGEFEPENGEAGLAGWTIYLDMNNNGQLDLDEPSTLTRGDDPATPEDETGHYSFTGLEPGTYVVAEVMQPNWEQTFPSDASNSRDRSHDPQADLRIVGGEEATPGDWPWMAALVFAGEPAFDGQFCGGSLIDSEWVLTAAHCVDGASPSGIDIVLGRHNLSSDEGERISVSAIHVHPDWNPDTIDSDLALLRLGAASEQFAVGTAAPSDAALFAPGVLATVTGWGRLAEGGAWPDTLHQVTVPIVSNDDANDSYGDTITDNMLAAGLAEGGKDSCNGDSGGPLVVADGDGGYLQAGIVSFGIGCARPDFYGIYTRVANFDDWIGDTIGRTTGRPGTHTVMLGPGQIVEDVDFGNRRIPTTDVVDLSLDLVDLNEVPGIRVGEQFDVVVRFTDTQNQQSVFSGYADVVFDPAVVRVDGITYDPEFGNAQTGTIANTAGLIDEVGATDGFGPTSDTRVFTMHLTAVGVGTTTIEANAGESALSETVIFGSDADQRNNTSYGSLRIDVPEDDPDLAPVRFDVTPDYAHLGRVTVDMAVANQDEGRAGAFQAAIVWSDDATIGNGDDVVVQTVSFPALNAGESISQTVELELDRAEFFNRAKRDDLPGQGLGYVSQVVDKLALIVDPDNLISESNETNNSGNGHLIDQDDFTYSPWDVDASGQVSPTDAIYVINRLGQSDAAADLSGDGQVTPTDAIAVVNRLGYLRNDDVVERTSERSDFRNDDVVVVSMTLVDLDDAPGIQVGEEFAIDVSFRDLATSQSVFAGYTDIQFDPSRLRIDSISYNAAFANAQTGTIDNETGLIDEVGATDGFGPVDETLVFTLHVTAIDAGQTTVTSNAGESAFSQTVIFGSDDDQRHNTHYGDLGLSITDPAESQGQAMAIRLQTTDPQGTPLSTVNVGDTFLVNALVSDLRESPHGVFAAFLDLTYDPQFAVLSGPIHYGDSFPNVHEGDATPAGLIDEVGAVADVNRLGAGEFVLFSIPFQAMHVGSTLFATDAADLLPQHDSLLSGQGTPVSVERIGFGQMTLDIVQGSIAVETDEDHVVDLLVMPDATFAVTSFDAISSLGAAVTNNGDGTLRYDPRGVHDLQALRATSEPVEDSFTYTLRDAQGGTTVGTATITVTGINDVPVVASPILDTVALPTLVSTIELVGTFSDIEADDLTYSVTLADGSTVPAWVQFDADTLRLVATPGLDEVGQQVTFVVQATDSGEPAQSVSEEFVLTVDNPYHNEAQPFDVNHDGSISPLDALVIINELNRNRPRNLPMPPTRGGSASDNVDVSNDLFITPLDALLVINQLNGPNAEGESTDGHTAESQSIATATTVPQTDFMLLGLPRNRNERVTESNVATPGQTQPRNVIFSALGSHSSSRGDRGLVPASTLLDEVPDDLLDVIAKDLAPKVDEAKLPSTDLSTTRHFRPSRIPASAVA